MLCGRARYTPTFNTPPNTLVVMRVVPRVFIPDGPLPSSSLHLEQVIRLAITLSLKKGEELPLHGHELKADAGVGEVEVVSCVFIMDKEVC